MNMSLSSILELGRVGVHAGRRHEGSPQAAAVGGVVDDGARRVRGEAQPHVLRVAQVEGAAAHVDVAPALGGDRGARVGEGAAARVQRAVRAREQRGAG